MNKFLIAITFLLLTLAVNAQQIQWVTWQEAKELTQTQQKKIFVDVYTEWCGYCKKARAYMRRNGFAFVEYDIEKDRFARAKYRQYGGKGVPLLVMGNKTLRGFTATRYDRFFR